jgi:hypothetical protein
MLFIIRCHNTYAPPLKAVAGESQRIETMPKILAASVSGCKYKWIRPNLFGMK